MRITYALEIILVFLLPGIKLFRLSDYRVQFVVYFAYINLQVSFAFLMATFFSNCRTASGMLLLECLHFCVLHMVLATCQLPLYVTISCSDWISLHNWFCLFRRIFIQAYFWRYVPLKSVPKLLLPILCLSLLWYIISVRLYLSLWSLILN